MAKDIVFNVKFNADGTRKSLGQLEQEYKQFSEEIENTAIGSEQFKELQKQLSQVGREIKNVELGFESLDNEQVASELGSVAGAVGDVSAAFVLLGDDSESMKEVAQNIESALGVSMAFKGAIEGVTSASKLLKNSQKAQNVIQGISNVLGLTAVNTAVANTAATTAETAAIGKSTVALNLKTLSLKALRIALISTGIGILIVGLGLLAANFDKVKTALGGAIDFLKELPIKIQEGLRSFREMGTGVQILMGVLSAGLIPIIAHTIGYLEELGAVTTAEAKRRFAAEQKAYNASRDLIREKVNLLEEEKKAVKEVTETAVEGLDYEIKKRQAAGLDFADIEKEKLQTLIRSTQEQLKLIQSVVDARQRELELAIENNSIFGEISAKILLENAQKEKAQQDEIFKEQLQALELFNIKQEKLRSDNVKKKQAEKKKEHEQELKDAKKRADEITLIESRAVAERAKLTNVNMDLYKAQNDLRIELMEEGLKKELQLSRNAFQERLKQLEEEGILTNDLRTKLIQEQVNNEEQIEKEFRLRQTEERINNASQVISALSSLNQTSLDAQLQAAGDNEAKRNQIRKQAFKRTKALQIAEATINGAQAVLKALSSPLPFVLGPIVAATAAANIAKIAATKFQGETGPTASGGV